MFEEIRRSDTGMPLWSSDLALERRRADISIPGVEYRKDRVDGFTWERIKIKSDEGARSIGRPCGVYDTLTLPRMDTLDEDAIEDAANEVAKELCRVADGCGIYPDRLLIVGLGNGNLTPDSIGPRTAERVNATMHVKDFDPETFDAMDCSEIAVLAPGVMANSGMETSDVMIGICDRIHPDAVIAVDSLASGSPKRLGTTIQISDTGIFPGSGIGSRRHPLNERVLGVPVIAIGVPTVIDARIFVGGEGSPLKDSDGPMFVSPQEIDGITNAAARIISLGINQAFGII